MQQLNQYKMSLICKNTINLHLSSQQDQNQSIHDLAVNSTATVARGVKELKRAEETCWKASSKYWVFLVFLAFSLVLIAMDYYYT